MSTREQILARVREALADVPADERPEHVAVPGDYRRESALEHREVLDLFVQTVEDYGARVHRVRPDGVSGVLREVLGSRGARTVVTPPGFPEQWVTAAGLVLLRDGPPMSTASLDRAGAVVSTATVAIAETGTIALVSGAGTGRRALTLLPDVHVCVVRTDQVVATVPEAFDRLAGQRTRPITLVSGGSATSDIEFVRVEGVHGPRTLEVVLVDVPSAG